MANEHDYSGPGEARDPLGDPRYKRAMDSLQVGDWEQAVAALRELAEDYPDSREIEHALQEALFRARVDADQVVKPRRWVVPWRKIGVYAGIVALLGLLAVGGVRAIGQPAMAELREQTRLAQIARHVQTCNAALAGDDLDGAEQCYQEVLVDEPDNAAALNGLDTIARQRQLLALYNQAIAAQAADDYEQALNFFTDLAVQAPRYKDVSQRITAVGRLLDIQTLYNQAEAAYTDGEEEQALSLYHQVRQQNASYEPEQVEARLIELDLSLGRAILTQNPPDLDRLPDARSYFEDCLTLDPRNSDAVEELRLLRLYLDGKSAYDQGDLAGAIARLQAIYDQRPGYLGGQVLATLYDAYVRNGDALQQSGDLALAYEQYRLAAALPVSDRALALDRLAAVKPLLTPTPTPQATATPRAAVPGQPTPAPTAKPLAAYSGYIAFYSDDEDNPGIWVMDSRGENREYLGNSRSVREQYEALYEQSQYSPDGRYRVFVKDVGRSHVELFVQYPADEDQPAGERQLTKLTGICYDPVWSPDGTRVVFVSQENGTDDIWVIDVDGSDPHNLTRNTWEWEKHPSWSPDSASIVFWSNRDGRNQVYVMDSEGRNVQNISNTDWDEYDPIWIR